MRISSKDRIGQKHGRLTTLHAMPTESARARYLFRCDCGTEKVMVGSHVFGGKAKSCGCLHAEMARNGPKYTPHGKAGSPVYRAWKAMRTRCQKPKCHSFFRYGARGIAVCERWESFQNFLEDMGEPQPGFSLDRIDNNGNYCPENCRWADSKTQARNRSTSINLTFQGSTKPLPEWAEITGIPHATIAARINRGWSVEKSLTAPIRKWPSEIAKESGKS